MQRPLRIAMICDSITDCLAGSFISTRRFSNLLKERGHTIIFIAARSPMNPVDGEYNGMRVYRFASIPIPKSESQVYLGFPSRRQLEDIFTDEKIDIVHSIIPTISAITATRVAEKLSIPVVAHSHTQPDNLFLHLPKFLPIKTISGIFYRYLHWIYRRAEAIIHPSEFSRLKFSTLMLSETHVISNGVDAAYFSRRNPAPFFAKYNIPPGRQYIVFVGRIHPEKSISTLIRAIPLMLQSNLNVHLIIVGFGHMETALAKLAKNLGVTDKVTMTGRVDDDDLIQAYSAADLFVMPSLAELEGMAVLEAMSVGAPILVADSPESAAKHFVDGNGALFRPGDHKHLAAEAIRILRDPVLLKSMKEANLEKIKNYDINRSVERIEEVYYRVLS